MFSSLWFIFESGWVGKEKNFMCALLLSSMLVCSSLERAEVSVYAMRFLFGFPRGVVTSLEMCVWISVCDVYGVDPLAN